jgi:hypothetical protein
MTHLGAVFTILEAMSTAARSTGGCSLKRFRTPGPASDWTGWSATMAELGGWLAAGQIVHMAQRSRPERPEHRND